MPRTNKILIRSGTAAPTASDFVTGEPAWDKTNGKFYIKDTAGTMVEIGAGGGGSTEIYEYATTASFPGTGAAATIYIDKSSNRLYRWSGSAYIEVGPPADSRWSLFLPPAPTTVTAAQRNQSALVSWTASVAAPLVTDYVVQYSSDSGSTWTNFSDGTSTATSAVVTGLTNGTAYTFRAAAVNGIGQGDWSSASASVTPAVGDAYFANVALLLRMDGTGTSFTDSSGTPKAITSNGLISQTTAQSKWGGKSVLVDNVTKFLSLGSAPFAMSGDFVLECWVYMLGSASSYVLLEARSNTSAFEDYVWYLDRAGYNGFVVSNSGARLDGTSALVPQNQWTHIAMVRSSGVLSAYVNGTRDAVTKNYTGTITPVSSLLRIGSSSSFFNGYIDDFRITIGSARGYGGSTISVPTAQFPDYG